MAQDKLLLITEVAEVLDAVWSDLLAYGRPDLATQAFKLLGAVAQERNRRDVWERERFLESQQGKE